MIVAKAGGAEARQQVVIGEGETKNVLLALKPSSAKADSTTPNEPAQASSSANESADHQESPGGARRTVAWIALGAGAVGLTLGTATGIWVLQKHSSLDCPEDSCTTDKSDDVDTFNTMRTVSTASLIAGFALGATGLTLLLTEPEQARPGVSLVVGPLHAGVKGVFQ